MCDGEMGKMESGEMEEKDKPRGSQTVEEGETGDFMAVRNREIRGGHREVLVRRPWCGLGAGCHQRPHLGPWSVCVDVC